MDNQWQVQILHVLIPKLQYVQTYMFVFYILFICFFLSLCLFTQVSSQCYHSRANNASPIDNGACHLGIWYVGTKVNAAYKLIADHSLTE